MNELKELMSAAVDRGSASPDALERTMKRVKRRERRRRITAGALAMVVAGAGIGFAVIAFRPGQSPAPAASTSSPFLSLWPQRSVELGPALLSDIGVVQGKADEGDPSATWQLSPTEVATRFATEVMGWPKVVVDSTSTNPDGLVVATVGFGAVNCLEIGPSGQTTSPAAGNCSSLPLMMGHEITLAQPGVQGASGIWEVVEVHPVTSSEFDLGVSRGEMLVAGQTLRFDFLDVPPGAVGLVASFDCARPLDVEGTVEVDPNHSIGTLTVPDLTAHGEGCIVPSPNGYLYAYSAGPLPETGAAGDPFKSSVEIGELAMVPVVLSRGVEVTSSPSPETEGVDATYTDALGWSMRYPSDWHLTEFEMVCMAGFTGALVANVPDAYHSPVSENGCYWPPRMNLLPPIGVVVEFDLMEGGPGTIGTPTTPDTTFPLSFDDLRVEPTPGPGPVLYSERVQVNGNARYHLNVWIGPEASAQDQEIARQIVSSITFTPSTSETPEVSPTPSTLASCLDARRLVPPSPGDAGSVYQTGLEFLRSLSPASYDPQTAWAMLDLWYVARMGWSSEAAFASSSEGEPYSTRGIEVSGRAERLTGPRMSAFLLARAGITAANCSVQARQLIAASAWYLTLVPKGGNAPAYILIVHERSGYRVLSSDV